MLNRTDLTTQQSRFTRTLPLSPGLKFTKNTSIIPRLKKLSPHKATGSDNMSCRLLHEGASLLSESLTYIFNLSIVPCRFPQQWKIATVIPLFKQRGDRQSPSNYRRFPCSQRKAKSWTNYKAKLSLAISSITSSYLLISSGSCQIDARQCSWCIFVKLGCIPWKTARAQVPFFMDFAKLLIEFGILINSAFLD